MVPDLVIPLRYRLVAIGFGETLAAPAAVRLLSNLVGQSVRRDWTKQA
jgi:hypothetical protein